MSVCLTCGDEGQLWKLIYCIKCNACAVHRYCVKKYTPGNGVIEWKCEDCAEETVSKISPSRKSERIVVRKDEAFYVRLGIKKKLCKNVFIKEYLKENSNPSENVFEAKENMPERCVLPIDSYPPKKRYVKEILVGNKKNLTENVDFTPESCVEVTEKPAENFTGNDNYTSEYCIEVKEKRAEKMDSINDSSLAVVSSNLYAAQVVSNQIWSMCKDEHFGMTAHLSTLSCRNEKVLEVAKALPLVMDLDILRRCETWPVTFEKCAPKDDNIALYLFPEGERDEQFCDTLLEFVNKHDMALKMTIDGVDGSLDFFIS